MRSALVAVVALLAAGCSLVGLDGLSGGKEPAEPGTSNDGGAKPEGSASDGGTEADGARPGPAPPRCATPKAYGPLSPSVADSVGGGGDWSAVQNALAVDGKAASATVDDGPTEQLVVQDFGFLVPETAQVVGIVVEVVRSADPTGRASDKDVVLVSGAAASESRAALVEWPTQLASQTYGGAGDPWGVALTGKDVSAPTFRVTLTARRLSGAESFDVHVDAVRVTVHACD